MQYKIAMMSHKVLHGSALLQMLNNLGGPSNNLIYPGHYNSMTH